MPKIVRPLPAPLVRGARRFAQWRRKRTTRSIPRQLWCLATRLGVAHGVSRTSRALGVHYYDLKKRVAAAGESSAQPVAPPAFVEVLPAAGMPSAECVVEFEDGSGAKMRIQMMGGNPPDLAALSLLFFAPRP